MYKFLQIISFFFQSIPRRFSLIFGRCIGLTIFYLYPIRKNIAIKNINIAFPNLAVSEKKEILKSSYKHFGMILVDFLRLPKIKKQHNKKIAKISKKYIELLKQNNGGILLSAHMGNWEYIGPMLGIYNFQCAGVSQIQHNNKSNQFFNDLRSSKNVQIIPKNSGSKIMIQTILDNKYLGLISDQNAGNKGTEASFFGHSTSIPKGAAAFHLKTNTAIVLAFCILRKDLNYDLSFQELNLQNLPKNSDNAIIEINQRFSDLLEEIVKKYPEQYFWFHRKWNKSIYDNLSIN